MLNDILLLFPVLLLIFTIHGFFRAAVAYFMGDSTARNEGFLSLNPLVHTNVYGLAIVLVIFLGIGTILPDFIPRRTFIIAAMFLLGIYWRYQTPLDDENFTNYRIGGILTSLAGPLGTLLLAFISLIVIKYMPYHLMPHYAIITCISFLRDLNDSAIWFTILELTPLPPFNGGDAIYYLLPTSQQEIFEWLYENSMYIILILYVTPLVSDIYFYTIALLSNYLKQFMLLILF